MRILTLIKYSLDVAEIKVDLASKELLLSGVPSKIGNIDRGVVEAAVQLRDLVGGSVQCLCLGPVAALDSFKDVLAIGADEAYLVEDPFAGAADARVATLVLEAAIRKLGEFDVILCGFASDDGYTYQVAPRLSERLGLPLVSYARQLQVSNGRLQADRDLEESVQTVEVQLPAIVSIAEEAYPPRRTTLMDAIKAKKKPVHTWQVQADLGLSRDELERANSFEAAHQIGVIVQRKRQMFKTGTPAELADQLIDALLHEEVLKGQA